MLQITISICIRILEDRQTGVLTETSRQESAAIYQSLNPISLLKQINENLEQLWSLAERSNPHPQAKSEEIR